MTLQPLTRPWRAAALTTLLSLLAACATTPSPTAGSTPETTPPATPAPLVVIAPTPEPQTPPPAPNAEPVDAAPTPVAVDPLRPGVPTNLDDRSARTDLWTRVRNGFGMPDLDTALVRDSERWYATRPDYVQRMTERGGRYLFHILEEVDKRGMPTELALLPFIESAFNPQAMSSANASGMWQFIPSTGRDFALKQNIFRDDRRDVLASTRAALDYLSRLHTQFGDWHLALAAYNWGEGSVARAIARNQKLGLPTDYLSLKMPNETQSYVPKLQAVKNIVMRPADFSLTLPELSNHPYFLSVAIERDIDVELAARLAGMKVDEFKTLNPQMNKPVILAAGTPQVLLPYDNANQFVRKLPLHRGPMASWTAWIAPKTLRPSEAAKQVGMSEGELREINHIPPRMLVKAGSTLLVPRGEHRQADVSEHIADNAVMALAPDVPPLRKLSLKAGRKETVASVARRYHVQPAQVAQWNNVAATAGFKVGQTVVVYAAGKAAKPTRTAAVSRKAVPVKRARVGASKAPVRVAKN